MTASDNPFKDKLLSHQPMTGLWVALGHPVAAEIAAGSGFDWILIDGEHAPNDIPLLLSQLQAAAALPAHAVVRLPVGEAWLIKQALDIGARNLLIPMVETAEQADLIARACLYPPEGYRGIGSSLARASNYNRIKDYLHTANDGICLIVQIESRVALSNIEAIAKTPGVTALFIGPADLAADMGHLGNSSHPDVIAAVDDAIARIRAAGKPAGIMITDLALARRFRDAGASLVAIGSDVTLLTAAMDDLLSRFQGETRPEATQKRGGY